MISGCVGHGCMCSMMGTCNNRHTGSREELETTQASVVRVSLLQTCDGRHQKRVCLLLPCALQQVTAVWFIKTDTKWLAQS